MVGGEKARYQRKGVTGGVRDFGLEEVISDVQN